jgi:hypothetical protein
MILMALPESKRSCSRLFTGCSQWLDYLGRTCPWKDCGPGIRQSCDALHCGQPHYLHDNLRAITLDSALIQTPPIELWPAVVPRVEVPADVEEVLLKPIRAGMQALVHQQPAAKPKS